MAYAMGLDISAGEIRLIQLYSKNESHIEVKQSALEFFNPADIVEGRIKNPEQIIEIISNLVKKMNIKNGVVAIALPYHCVISKRIKLPCYRRDLAREEEIIEHLREYLPGLHEEISFDFIDLGRREDDSQELLLFAAKRSQLDAYINIVVNSGLKVGCIDLDVYAFMRGVKWHQSIAKCVAFLSVNKKVQLTLVENDEVIFTQSLTELNSITAFIQEIKSTLKMHSIFSEKISQMIVMGETHFDCERLEKELAIPINKWIPDRRQLAIAPDFFTAFGLALRRSYV